MNMKYFNKKNALMQALEKAISN